MMQVRCQTCEAFVGKRACLNMCVLLGKHIRVRLPCISGFLQAHFNLPRAANCFGLGKCYILNRVGITLPWRAYMSLFEKNQADVEIVFANNMATCHLCAFESCQLPSHSSTWDCRGRQRGPKFHSENHQQPVKPVLFVALSSWL